MTWKKLYGWWFCGCLVYGVVGEGVVADKKKIATAKGRQDKLGHPISGRSENTKKICVYNAWTVYIHIDIHIHIGILYYGDWLDILCLNLTR